ncbi:transglycosylase domain-containing protein [Helicobacter anatolicus]|uniref:transglycosylase domain-containing protein n=1 Tax=Helicobacter anatolicus TaxID=2905874 RepID=UPI001E3F8176|nr:PBP1A family penicillin-binding protein [Helicobacter anatolicus]MCE3039502.1 PBP1A family penicillin-binding protein [Helicobacter anatolicus]
MIFSKKRFLVALGVVLGILFCWFFSVWISLQADIDKLKNYTPQLTTQILDRKDRLVANVFGNQFRFYATFSEIPPRMIEALLAVEDTLFFEHHGINYDAILRAIVKNLRHGKYSEGGSTLTQQLIKNAVLTRDKTLYRKIKEAILAIQIEFLLSKEEILERYLNDTFLGHGYYGIKAAALGYFRKSLDQLSLKEIAMIAGLPRAPSFYDPTKNIDFSLSRANNILERMYTLGWIGENEYKTALVEIPEVYNQSLAQNKAPYVVDMVLKQLDYIQDIRTGGYIVKVGIDLDYQTMAQEAMEKGYKNAMRINKLDENEHMLNGAMIVTQVKSGEILALIGGIDYSKSAFNRATQAKRQIGSTIKPFVYLNAFDLGYSPATMIADVARSFDNSDNEDYWRPRNAGNSFNGIVSLRYALIHSLNLATINLVDMVGFDKTFNALEKYSLNPREKNLTIILGSLIASPMDLARAYSIFSNQGVMLEPQLVKELIKRDGSKQVFHNKQEEITSPQQAYLVTSILQEVVKNGTGRWARVRKMDVAGKTGTTNNNNDAWFCGFTPEVQAVIWFGNDNNGSIGKIGGGTSIVAPIFSDFINKILKIDPGMERNFEKPDGVYQKTINGVKYFYTEVSKLPEKKITDDENKLIF